MVKRIFFIAIFACTTQVFAHNAFPEIELAINEFLQFNPLVDTTVPSFKNFKVEFEASSVFQELNRALKSPDKSISEKAKKSILAMYAHIRKTRTKIAHVEEKLRKKQIIIPTLSMIAIAAVGQVLPLFFVYKIVGHPADLHQRLFEIASKEEGSSEKAYFVTLDKNHAPKRWNPSSIDEWEKLRKTNMLSEAASKIALYSTIALLLGGFGIQNSLEKEHKPIFEKIDKHKNRLTQLSIYLLSLKNIKTSG